MITPVAIIVQGSIFFFGGLYTRYRPSGPLKHIFDSSKRGTFCHYFIPLGMNVKKRSRALKWSMGNCSPRIGPKADEFPSAYLLLTF